MGSPAVKQEPLQEVGYPQLEALLLSWARHRLPVFVRFCDLIQVSVRLVSRWRGG